MNYVIKNKQGKFTINPKARMTMSNPTYSYGTGYEKTMSLDVETKTGNVIHGGIKLHEAILENGFPIRRGQWISKGNRKGRYLHTDERGIMYVVWHSADEGDNTFGRLHRWTTAHKVREVQKAKTNLDIMLKQRSRVQRVKDVFK